MGLNGFFGKLLKGIATAIGGAIGGVVGATIASQVFEWADNAFFNNSLTDNQGWFVPVPQQPNNVPVFNPSGKGMTLLPITPEQAEQIRVASLKNWLQNKITSSWINTFFSALKNVNPTSNEYRSLVNTTLLRLEALRLYYAGKANQHQAKGVIANIDQIISEAEVKSKAELFQVLATALRSAYEKALKQANIEIYEKTLPNFKANKYNIQGKAPEAILFNFQANADVKLYVFKPTDVETITYTDGTQASTADQATVPNTPSVTDTYPTATTAINQQLKTASLWLVGAIGVGWLWKQFNSKPQN